MLPLIPLAGAAAVALSLYLIVSYVLVRRRHAAMANAYGCKPAPVYPSTDPLGVLDMVQVAKDANNGVLLDTVQDWFTTMTKREGRETMTYENHFLRNWAFFTCDPKNIQALLATQFKDYCLGTSRQGSFSPLLGIGIFSSDGARWEHSRGLLRPQFVRQQISDLDLEERHLQNMLRVHPVQADGWTAVSDLQPSFFRLTIDSASEFLCGESVNSQLAALPGHDQPGEDDANVRFINAFEESQDLIAHAFRMTDWYRLGLTKGLYDRCKVCHEYIDRFVQKALERRDAKVGSEKSKYVFIEALAEATQDPVEIRNEVLSILVAGRDTTASLLSFLFIMFSLHPQVFQKLRAKVLEEFGTYDNPKEISFASLKNCTYLQWCMQETLRLFPSVPVNSRRSAVDTTLPRGGGPDGQSPLFVPKDTEVMYTVYVMHRNKTLWGEDAEEFVPDRWAGRKSGFEYLPFNGGPRVCLGQQFALTEAGYITVRLLQKFDRIEAESPLQLPLKWMLTLTGRPYDGVKLRMHEAA